MVVQRRPFEVPGGRQERPRFPIYPHPYFSGGPGHGWWFLLVLVLLLYAVLLGGVAVLAVRLWRHRGPGIAPGTAGRGEDAEAILSERFARGEIDLQEYQARLAALRDARRT